MRILLDVSAVPPRPVGAGMYTLALAAGLSRRDDLDLHVYARTGDARRWHDVAERVTVHAVAPAPRPLRVVAEQSHGPRLARRVAADVWHGPHYTMPLRMQTPAVVTVHDCTFFDRPEWHERTKVPYFRRMIRASARRARALLCVSDHTARRLRALTATRAPVVVVPHGVDHERFTPRADPRHDAHLLARHGVRPPYVLFVGTLEPRKDVPGLVTAFARVSAARPELRLVLAGADGWGADAVRDAIAGSGAATRVIRCGYVADDVVPALYRNAAVVAYPSLEEGFGLPALEALACGAPLVTTSGSALEEVADDAALLVEPGDTEGLAAALAKLIEHDGEAAALRERGPRRAAAFTWDDAVDRHVGAYRVAAGTVTA